ncbi:hypothetical protein AMS68_005047 [Peltaster fructicola]|uniref:Laccase n=1 Tax=Peltaster fructicola TaxID=286661 RepID=A0A6H0XYN6_9PEZI|nr:hypothetical protein AMS68_005047 [Peltaster fructicola]
MKNSLLISAGLASLVAALPQLDLGITVDLDLPTLKVTPVSSVQATVETAVTQSTGGDAASDYTGPAFLPTDVFSDLVPQLPQAVTNGATFLGTLWAPHLPDWLNGSPLPQGFPWGGRTSANTDPYTDPPETGVTRHYDFTVTRKTIYPDGVAKNGIVVNNAFPGPTIEANWGDWIEVAVHNQLDEGTSLHWHGLLQKDTPYMDGVPGVSQCPIAPGKSFTYRFKADLYGTSWWHAHYSAQYAGGILGPMIIYGPHDNADYDIDLGPVLLTDWYHDDYFTLIEQVMAPAKQKLPPPVSNNNLINGKMNYPCKSIKNGQACTPNAGISKFNFISGKTYRLRLINAGAEGIQKFSIDNHQMTVIANDFVPVQPYNVDVVTLGVGQRTDIIVKANGSSRDAVWMRSDLGKSAFVGGCTLTDGISPLAVAAIYYQDADKNAEPNTTSSVTAEQINSCKNDPLEDTVPYYAITPAANPAVTTKVDITYQSNGTHDLFFMSNSSFRTDFNDPIYLEAKLGNDKFAPEWNVYNYGSNSSIRIVLYNHALTGAHPMHLHGHNYDILAEGFGTWNGDITRPQNPQRRDVHILQNAQDANTPAYMVLQIDADNPGSWPLHCHIAWHVSAGLYITVLERPDDIKKVNIPSTVAQTCRDWASFSGSHVVEQIDSGL